MHSTYEYFRGKVRVRFPFPQASAKTTAGREKTDEPPRGKSKQSHGTASIDTAERYRSSVRLLRRVKNRNRSPWPRPSRTVSPREHKSRFLCINTDVAYAVTCYTTWLSFKTRGNVRYGTVRYGTHNDMPRFPAQFPAANTYIHTDGPPSIKIFCKVGLGVLLGLTPFLARAWPVNSFCFCFCFNE